MSNAPLSPAGHHASTTERFGRAIERRDGSDFPFYNGIPTTITGRQWWLVLAAVVVAFVALILLPLSGPVTGFIPAILFTGIPLAALAYIARQNWTAIFRRVSGRDVGLMFFFAALNLAVTVAAGLLVSATTGAAANPESGALAQASPLELALFYPRTAIQLLGEELLTILPFLALLYFLVAKRGWSRNRAVLVCWFATAVMFGLVHLPTYSWNVLQCILVIGGARVVLTLAYIRTKNIWVSTGAHILNDWALFTAPLLSRLL